MALTAVLMASSGAAAAGITAFGDVSPSSYYAEAVAWMAEEGVTLGVSPGCFGPHRSATRGEVATFLHRMRDEPAPTGSHDFADVSVSSYYAAAVAWMAGTGVTNGTTDTTFSPGRIVTRAEVATFLYRLALLDSGLGPNSPPSAQLGSTRFVDVAAGSYYDQPVGWLAAEGITVGTGPDTFDPHRTITRAELAAMLYRSVGEPATELTVGHCIDDTAPTLAAAEAEILNRLDALRAEVGVARLEVDPELTAGARSWSLHMALTGDFGHSEAGGAENVARWSQGAATPEEAAGSMFDAWVVSTDHYDNLTTAWFNVVGVGVIQDPYGRWWATIRFAEHPT